MTCHQGKVRGMDTHGCMHVFRHRWNAAWRLIVWVSLLLATVATVRAKTTEPLEFRITIKRHADGALQAEVRVPGRAT